MVGFWPSGNNELDGPAGLGYLIGMRGEIKKTGWEHFPHRADMGIRGFGATREQAFEQAAIALIAIITEPARIEAEQKVKITCTETDDELLFVDWLNRLLYEMATRKMLFGRFEVHIEQGRLNATAWGQRTERAKHRPVVEVKAATYTALSVRQDENGMWTAQCIVDV